MAKKADLSPVELHFKNAKIADLDSEAARIKELYKVYRTIRKLTRNPGDIAMDFNIRDGDATLAAHQGVTLEMLKEEAARFRMLKAITEHVTSDLGNAAKFDLSFDLACRQLPEIFPEFEGPAGGPIEGPMGLQGPAVES